NQSAYNLGANQPSAPWSTAAPVASGGPAAAETPMLLTAGAVTPTPLAAGRGSSLARSNPLSSPTNPPAGAATSEPGPTASPWPPPLVPAPGMPLAALEALPGAGQWSPY